MCPLLFLGSNLHHHDSKGLKKTIVNLTYKESLPNSPPLHRTDTCTECWKASKGLCISWWQLDVMGNTSSTPGYPTVHALVAELSPRNIVYSEPRLNALSLLLNF